MSLAVLEHAILAEARRPADGIPEGRCEHGGAQLPPLALPMRLAAEARTRLGGEVSFLDPAPDLALRQLALPEAHAPAPTDLAGLLQHVRDRADPNWRVLWRARLDQRHVRERAA